MPRLNNNFARCVFFLYGRHPKTNELTGPEGTGVLIGYYTDTERDRRDLGVAHIYAVTCAHVAPQGASVIRINTIDGKSRLIDLHPDIDWITPENGADVAAADITDQLIQGDDVNYIGLDQFAGKGFIERVALGIGDDGFMLGLFAAHPGKDYNRIAAKFGNISLMADEGDQIAWEGRRPMPAHLFDIRSRGGFSGSPVFVYRTPDGDLRSVDDGVRRRTTKAPNLIGNSSSWVHMRPNVRDGENTASNWNLEYDTENNIFLRLLGIHAAQYPETVKARKLPKAKAESNDDTLRHGDNFLIEGGTTIVVPAWEVRALLDHKQLIKRRDARRKELGLGDDGAVSESAREAVAEMAPPPTDE